MLGIQAEQERKRILQRLKEGREAQSKPHQPRWFTFHPEVTGLTMCKHPLVSDFECFYARKHACILVLVASAHSGMDREMVSATMSSRISADVQLLIEGGCLSTCTCVYLLQWQCRRSLGGSTGSSTITNDVEKQECHAGGGGRRQAIHIQWRIL